MRKILMLRSNPFEPDERVYKEAKSLLKNGYDVKLISWDRDLKYPEEEVFDGIKIERIGLKAGYGSLGELAIKMPLFWFKALLKAWHEDYDVLHCYDYDTLPVGTFLKIFKDKKVVYDALELFLSYTANETTNKIIFFLERMNLPFIDALIYTNQERLNIFLKKTKLGKRTVVIHNYPQLGMQMVEKTYRKPIFQYNGRINEDRNILNIVKAFKELNNHNQEFLFYIIGGHQNPYGERIKKYIEENGLEKTVLLKGFLPIDQIFDFSKKTNIGFVPLAKDCLNNLIPEPNKLYNYFATGNFAIVEDIPYLQKIVEEEGTGIICDFSEVEEIKDTIQWVIDNMEKVEKMIERAYHSYLEKYNWENEEKKLIDLYGDIIQI